MTPRTLRASADINVTPLIDVLLVLLIIFLAALPLTQTGVDVGLPQQADARPVPGHVGEDIVLEYTADRTIAVNRHPTKLSELGPFLRHVYEARRDKTMFIIGDPSLAYGDIVNVIDAAKGAGVERVGIVTTEMRRGAGQ